MARHKKSADSPVDIVDALHERIRARAYQLYCESGYQPGHETEHWLEAERQILNRRKPRQRELTAQLA